MRYNEKIDDLYENFGEEKIIPKFSRHSIIHGADIKYGTEKNSLTLILILDYIHHYCEIIKTEKVSLPEVDPKKERGRIINNISELKNKGIISKDEFKKIKSSCYQYFKNLIN